MNEGRYRLTLHGNIFLLMMCPNNVKTRILSVESSVAISNNKEIDKFTFYFYFEGIDNGYK